MCQAIVSSLVIRIGSGVRSWKILTEVDGANPYGRLRYWREPRCMKLSVGVDHPSPSSSSLGLANFWAALCAVSLISTKNCYLCCKVKKETGKVTARINSAAPLEFHSKTRCLVLWMLMPATSALLQTSTSALSLRRHFTELQMTPKNKFEKSCWKFKGSLTR